jgi:hypothetical protein
MKRRRKTKKTMAQEKVAAEAEDAVLMTVKHEAKTK